MRIIWKDTTRKNVKPIKYRGHFASWYQGGWVIDVPGDNNIYKNNYCAQNAIDQALGGHSYKGPPAEKRAKHGIQIIGKKDETA